MAINTELPMDNTYLWAGMMTDAPETIEKSGT